MARRVVECRLCDTPPRTTLLTQRGYEWSNLVGDERRRQRVADQASGLVLSVCQRKPVVARECLKERGLSERDSAIFLWVQEATLGRVDASARDRGCWLIPGHASINIVPSGYASMARELPIGSEIASTATVFGYVSYELHDLA